MPRKQIDTKPGWTSNGDASFVISERVYAEGGFNYDVTEIANYTLTYLPDTNEVALIKDGEIVYSEEVI